MFYGHSYQGIKITPTFLTKFPSETRRIKSSSYNKDDVFLSVNLIASGGYNV